MKIGYIAIYEPGSGGRRKEKFDLYEGDGIIETTPRGDRIRSDAFPGSIDYNDVLKTTNKMKSSELIVVGRPFLIDNDLKAKVLKWIDYANKDKEDENGNKL